MKKLAFAFALVSLTTLGAAAQGVKVIKCSPFCNMQEKHLHAVTRVAKKSARLAAFPLRHPVRFLKDIF